MLKKKELWVIGLFFFNGDTAFNGVRLLSGHLTQTPSLNQADR